MPISLYITVEIIKGLQIFFLSQDVELYDEESVRFPATGGRLVHVANVAYMERAEPIQNERACHIEQACGVGVLIGWCDPAPSSRVGHINDFRSSWFAALRNLSKAIFKLQALRAYFLFYQDLFIGRTSF